MSLEASVINLEVSNNSILSQLTKDRDHALALVGELKKEKLCLEDDQELLLEEVATLTKDFKSLESRFVLISEMCDHPQEEAHKEKEVEVPNSCCDELVDQVASLKRHNALLLEITSLQKEALDEYYRLSKEKVSCCNHDEEIAALEKTKAKILELNGMQEEFLMECLRMSKETVNCSDHEEEFSFLKRSKAQLMEVNSMLEEALKEYFPLSKDRDCCTHEGDIAILECHKCLLMKMNSPQEEALKEHFRVNKEKEVQVFDITHPHPEHEDEVNHLKAKIDRLQIQAKYLEGVLEAKDGVNKGSRNEGGVATKPKRKRRRRTKKKKKNKNMGITWLALKEKMHGAPHKAKTIISTTRCLDLLHVDLFSPLSHERLGGKKYCLVIVDDYSRYCWVFFFKQKSETQRTMMEFANQVQRKFNAKVIAIRSDNGTEFKNYTLDDFLGEEGIQH
ncbi:hypothetical protein QYE76_055887 [Lolium multiflorum]|uniref:Integrase catalytic domain-containing protein n=1 Tax=Lolium multiflorum TaxID=4521 RepID=A0AAD8T283_LOLMU|nr:hypothetical protein QYE76_055887 [Lolium multiflorum]